MSDHAVSRPPSLSTEAGTPDHLPHDIYGLGEYPFELLAQWWFWVLLVGLIVAVGVFIWWWRRRHSSQKEVVVQVDPLVQLLKVIDAAEPVAPFRGPDYFYELGLTLRQVIEATTSIAATDCTINELRAPLQQHLFLGHEAKIHMLKFFERADMIKFADAPTTITEAGEWYEEVRQWSRKLVSDYRLRQVPSSPSTHLASEVGR